MLKWTSRGALGNVDIVNPSSDSHCVARVESSPSLGSQIAQRSALTTGLHYIRVPPLQTDSRSIARVRRKSGVESLINLPASPYTSHISAPSSPSKSEKLTMPTETFSQIKNRSISLPPSPHGSFTSVTRGSEESKKKGVLTKFKNMFRKSSSKAKDKKNTPKFSSSQHSGFNSPVLTGKQMSSLSTSRDTGKAAPVDVLIGPRSRLTRLIEAKREQRKSSRVLQAFHLPETSPSKASGVHDLLSASSAEDCRYPNTFYQPSSASYVDQFLFLPPGTTEVSSNTTPEEVDSLDTKQQKSLSRQRFGNTVESGSKHSSPDGIPPRCPKERPALHRSTSLKSNISSPDRFSSVIPQTIERSIFGLRNFTFNPRKATAIDQRSPEITTASRNLKSFSETLSRSELSLLEYEESLITSEKGHSSRVKVMPSRLDEIVEVKKSLVSTNRDNSLKPVQTRSGVNVSPQDSIKSKTFQWSLTEEGGLIISPKTEAESIRGLRERSPESTLRTFTRNNNNGHREVSEVEMQTSVTEVMLLEQRAHCDTRFVPKEKYRKKLSRGTEQNMMDDPQRESKTSSTCSTPPVSPSTLGEIEGLLSTRPRVKDIVSSLERSPERPEAASIAGYSCDKSVPTTDFQNNEEVCQIKCSKHRFETSVNRQMNSDKLYIFASDARISDVTRGNSDDIVKKGDKLSEKKRYARASPNLGRGAHINDVEKPRTSKENQTYRQKCRGQDGSFFPHIERIHQLSGNDESVETDKAGAPHLSYVNCGLYAKHSSNEVPRLSDLNDLISDDNTGPNVASYPDVQKDGKLKVNTNKSVVLDTSPDSKEISATDCKIHQDLRMRGNVEDANGLSVYKSSSSSMRDSEHSSELKLCEQRKVGVPPLKTQTPENDDSGQAMDPLNAQGTQTKQADYKIKGEILDNQKIGTYDGDNYKVNQSAYPFNSILPTANTPVSLQESQKYTQGTANVSQGTAFSFSGSGNENSVVSECGPLKSPACSGGPLHPAISGPTTVSDGPSLQTGHMVSINKAQLCRSFPAPLQDLCKLRAENCDQPSVDHDKTEVKSALHTSPVITKARAQPVVMSPRQDNLTGVRRSDDIAASSDQDSHEAGKNSQPLETHPSDLVISQGVKTVKLSEQSAQADTSSQNIDIPSVENVSYEIPYQKDSKQTEDAHWSGADCRFNPLKEEPFTSPRLNSETEPSHGIDEGITDVRAPISMVMQDSSTLEEVHDHHLDLLAIKTWETFFSLDDVDNQGKVEAAVKAKGRTPPPAFNKRDVTLALHSDPPVDNTAIFEMPSCALVEYDLKLSFDSGNLKNKKKVSFAVETTSPEISSRSDDKAVIEPNPCTNATIGKASNDGPENKFTDPRGTASSTDLSGSFSGRSNEIPGTTPQITSTSADDVSWWGPEVIEDMEFLHDQSLLDVTDRPEQTNEHVSLSESEMSNTQKERGHKQGSPKDPPEHHPFEILTISSFLSAEIEGAEFEIGCAKKGSQDLTGDKECTGQPTRDGHPEFIKPARFCHANDQEATNRRNKAPEAETKKDLSDIEAIYPMYSKEKELGSLVQSSSVSPEQTAKVCEVNQDDSSSTSADSHTYNVSPKVLRNPQSKFFSWQTPEVDVTTESSPHPQAEIFSGASHSRGPHTEPRNLGPSEDSDETWTMSQKESRVSGIEGISAVKKTRLKFEGLRHKRVYKKNYRTKTGNTKHAKPHWLSISEKQPVHRSDALCLKESDHDKMQHQIKKEIKYPSTEQNDIKRKRRMRETTTKRKKRAVSLRRDECLFLQTDWFQNSQSDEEKSSSRSTPALKSLCQYPIQPMTQKQSCKINDVIKQNQESEDSLSSSHTVRNSSSPLSLKQAVPALKHRWYKEKKRMPPENPDLDAFIPELDHRYWATVGPMTHLHNGLRPPPEDQCGSGDPGESSEDTSFGTLKEFQFRKFSYCRSNTPSSQGINSSIHCWPVQLNNLQPHNGPNYKFMQRQNSGQKYFPNAPFHDSVHLIQNSVPASGDERFLSTDSVYGDSSCLTTSLPKDKKYGFDGSGPEQDGLHYSIHHGIRQSSRDTEGRAVKQHRSRSLARDPSDIIRHRNNESLRSQSQYWQQFPEQQHFQQQRQYQQQPQQQRQQQLHEQYSGCGGSDDHSHYGLPHNRGQQLETPFLTDPFRHHGRSVAVSKTAGPIKSRLDSQPAQWLFIATFFVFQLFLHCIYAR